jgi:hypothetical protein
MWVKRQARELTEEAQIERYEFERDERGCTCFISPPCSSCTHPGNPLNQDEDESCWHMVEYEEFDDPVEGSW